MKKSSLKILTICTLLLFVQCKQIKKSEFSDPIPVKVLEMKCIKNIQEHNYVGTVEESFNSALSFQVAGNVDKTFVGVGDQVKEGQLLASLDPKTAQDAYNAAKASLEQAQDAYNRLEKVYKGGSLPEIKWVEMQTKLAQAQSVEAISKKSLEDCNLYAPFSGIIASRSIETGMNVLPYVPVYNLMKVNDLKVRVSIPENEIANTKIGQSARIEVSALNGAVFNGKIIERGIEAHTLSRSYPIKIAINDAQQQLLPGMVCKVFLRTENEKNEFVVPTDAVQLSYSGERFLWIAENNIAKRKLVIISDLVKDGVVISEGLAEGDKVIIAGYHKISDGMRISVSN